MKILIMGAGKMGSFFIDLLSFDHEVAAYEKDPKRLRFTYNCQRFQTLEEVRDFKPQLVINAVTVKYTLAAFREVMPYLPGDCIVSDIASVKTGLKDFYGQCGHPYVSWPHLRQPQPVERGERHHHQRGRLHGPHLLQGPLPEAGTQHL